MSLPVYILAGGRSSRFGSDKARAPLHGTPLLAAVAQTFSERGHAITVVAREADEYADLGLRTIADRAPGLGPLAGLQAALEDRVQHGWLALVSCDWAGLNAEWLDVLRAHVAPERSAVAFHDDRWQPLLALYHTRLRDRVGQRLQAGPRSLHGLLEACEATPVAPPEGWSRAHSINTPEALARYLRASSRRSPKAPTPRSTAAHRKV